MRSAYGIWHADSLQHSKLHKIWTRYQSIWPRLSNVPDTVTSCHYWPSTLGGSIFFMLTLRFLLLYVADPPSVCKIMTQFLIMCHWVSAIVKTDPDTEKQYRHKYCWWTGYCTKPKADISWQSGPHPKWYFHITYHVTAKRSVVGVPSVYVQDKRSVIPVSVFAACLIPVSVFAACLISVPIYVCSTKCGHDPPGHTEFFFVLCHQYY